VYKFLSTQTAAATAAAVVVVLASPAPIVLLLFLFASELLVVDVGVTVDSVATGAITCGEMVTEFEPSF